MAAFFLGQYPQGLVLPVVAKDLLMWSWSGFLTALSSGRQICDICRFWIYISSNLSIFLRSFRSKEMVLLFAHTEDHHFSDTTRWYDSPALLEF